MNRRDFLKMAGIAMTGPHPLPLSRWERGARHVVWILNSASRKQDWYRNPDISPNFNRLAKEAFVYEESHNDTVAHHGRALQEMLSDLENHPRLLICRFDGQDVGHESYLEYERACRETDAQAGGIIDFLA